MEGHTILAFVAMLGLVGTRKKKKTGVISILLLEKAAITYGCFLLYIILAQMGVHKQ